VGFDAFFEAAEDRPQVEVVGLEVAEIPSGVLEALAGGRGSWLAGTGVRST
jgi:hypothetical protein